jgi:hypothetical protein
MINYGILCVCDSKHFSIKILVKIPEYCINRNNKEKIKLKVLPFKKNIIDSTLKHRAADAIQWIMKSYTNLASNLFFKVEFLAFSFKVFVSAHTKAELITAYRKNNRRSRFVRGRATKRNGENIVS